MDLTGRRFGDFDGDDSDHALVQRAVDATGQFFAGTFSFSRSISGLYSGETSSPSVGNLGLVYFHHFDWLTIRFVRACAGVPPGRKPTD